MVGDGRGGPGSPRDAPAAGRGDAAAAPPRSPAAEASTAERARDAIGNEAAWIGGVANELVERVRPSSRKA